MTAGAKRVVRLAGGESEQRMSDDVLHAIIDRLRDGWRISEYEPVWCRTDLQRGRESEPMTEAEAEALRLEQN